MKSEITFIFRIFIFMKREDIRKDVLKDYQEGLSIEKIKVKYKTSHETIKKICLEANIWDYDRHFKMTRLTNVNKSIKENPFKDLNNPEVQYWLGLLATDGALSRNNITLILSSKDIDTIKRFKNFTKSSNKIFTYQDKRFKNSYLSGFRFACYETSQFLISLGIGKKKSFTLTLKTPITWDMLRGIIDGDGCIAFYKSNNKYNCTISITTGSKNFSEQISSFYTQNNIKNRIYCYNKNNKPHYIIQVTNFCNCKQVISKLYTNADIFMRRKYLKAQLISNYQLKIESKFREPALGILSETYDNIENK